MYVMNKTFCHESQICWQVHQLREVWQTQRPKIEKTILRLFCLEHKSPSRLSLVLWLEQWYLAALGSPAKDGRKIN